MRVVRRRAARSRRRGWRRRSTPPGRARAAALRYEPIATVYPQRPAPLPAPMLAPAQRRRHAGPVRFDRGQLGGPGGLLAFVISGAAIGSIAVCAAASAAALAQAAAQLGRFGAGRSVVHTIVERRATFALHAAARPAADDDRARLLAAGDYVEGPYPATLEGAVRSGVGRGRAPQLG